MTIEKLVMRLTGTDSFGDGQYGPPEPKALRYRIRNSNELVRVPIGSDGYQVITSNNDGFEMWIGWDKKWDTHMNAREVRALFWWILIEWFAKSRWFGLRRPIYYWALHRHVAQFRKVSK